MTASAPADRQSLPSPSVCTDCGTEFACMAGPDCWCMDLPHQPMPEAAGGCLCPACLRRRIEAAAPR